MAKQEPASGGSRAMRAKIIHLITLLSDIDAQREIWVNQIRPDMACSFGETINLLDDYGFFDTIDTIISNLKNTLDKQEVKAFAKDLLVYEEPRHPAQLLEDTRWLHLVQNAIRVRYILASST